MKVNGHTRTFEPALFPASSNTQPIGQADDQKKRQNADLGCDGKAKGRPQHKDTAQSLALSDAHGKVERQSGE